VLALNGPMWPERAGYRRRAAAMRRMKSATVGTLAA